MSEEPKWKSDPEYRRLIAEAGAARRYFNTCAGLLFEEKLDNVDAAEIKRLEEETTAALAAAHAASLSIIQYLIQHY